MSNKLTKLKSLPGWLWRLRLNREWQRSTGASAAFWIVNTLVIYNVVGLLGHGWQFNMAVSLASDVVLYLVSKLWVWRKREASVARSGSFWFAWWLTFFLLNGTLAWALMGEADVEAVRARIIMAGIGIAINPLVFTFRDKGVFKLKTKIEKA